MLSGIIGRLQNLGALLGLSWLLTTSPVAAQASADELGRRHFESGVAYLQESDYENALKAFDKAYELSSRPPILLNIATVYERMGNLSSAIGALERYLAVAPDAEDRLTVQSRIENLRKRNQARPRHESETPPAPETHGSPPSAPAAPPPVAAPPVAAPPPAAPNPPPPEPPPAPDRTWTYVAFGVGGAALLGATVTGIMASTEHNRLEGECAPGCTDADTKQGENLALVNTVLLGVGAVGVGLGLVMWLGEDTPAQEQARARGSLQLTPVPGGVAARAVWSF